MFLRSWYIFFNYFKNLKVPTLNHFNLNKKNLAIVASNKHCMDLPLNLYIKQPNKTAPELFTPVILWNHRIYKLVYLEAEHFGRASYL